MAINDMFLPIRKQAYEEFISYRGYWQKQHFMEFNPYKSLGAKSKY